ncbi:MAG: RNA degradosome polyphosphate kinase [Nostocoides sp.]
MTPDAQGDLPGTAPAGPTHPDAPSTPESATEADGALMPEVSVTTSSVADRRRHLTRGPSGRFVPAQSSQVPDLPDDRFLDREISWLQFNERVLQLAADEHTPLLERARFLAIFTSNLDEFFMVRVAGLKRRIATGIAVRSSSGLEPREVLDQIGQVSHELLDLQARVFHEGVRPALSEEGIHIARWEQLTPQEQAGLSELFTDQLFPVLTPLAVDPAHPFPYISGLSLNLAVLLVNARTGKEHFARVKVPPSLPRLVEVTTPESDPYAVRFVPLEDIIAAHLDQLFPGMDIVESFTFRVTRNEDVEVEEDDAENLLTALEKELTRRRFGPPVRLEVDEDMEDHVMDLLIRELGIRDSEVYRLPAPLDLRALNIVADLERSELHFPPFAARANPDLAPVERSSAADILGTVKRRDVLVQHPYDSFSTSVQAFVEQAAADPRVLAIKQTLYRTSGDSPIVNALIEAAEAGKQVLAVVEIKARFDEENNITWARKLEQAGVHVVYGIVGLKTHCKLSLVVRQEGDVVRRYCHIGTGNYNPKTARLYEDFGLLTADPAIGEDATRLFNQLSGLAPRTRYRRLLVAPRSLRSGLIERIEDQTKLARAGKPSAISLKLNALVDETVIDAIYRASQAGVPVRVLVRGTCSIRPGVPGLSENIEVRSILGRFLEHSRVFVFGADDAATTWIGSADMMHRNLDRRVEALVEVTNPAHVADLVGLLNRAMDDRYAHWRLGPDGRWSRIHLGSDGQPLEDFQGSLIAMHGKRVRKARRR